MKFITVFFLLIALLAASAFADGKHGGHQHKAATSTATIIGTSTATVTNGGGAAAVTDTETVTETSTSTSNAAGRAEIPALASVAALAVAGMLLAAW